MTRVLRANIWRIYIVFQTQAKCTGKTNKWYPRQKKLYKLEILSFTQPLLAVKPKICWHNRVHLNRILSNMVKYCLLFYGGWCFLTAGPYFCQLTGEVDLSDTQLACDGIGDCLFLTLIFWTIREKLYRCLCSSCIQFGVYVNMLTPVYRILNIFHLINQ